MTLLPAILGCCLALPPTPLTDAHGDPLPPGAAARIGTVRLRHADAITSLAFSPDSARISAATLWFDVAVWDARTGRALAFRSPPSQGVLFRATVSPDGSLFAGRLDSGALGVQDAVSGKERHSFAGDGRTDALAFSRNNRWLTSADEKGNVFLWDLAAGKLSRQWKSPEQDVSWFRQTFTHDSNTLIHATHGGHIFFWDAHTGKELLHIEPKKDNGSLYGLAISRDGALLATRLGTGWLHLWDAKTGKFLREIQAQVNHCGPIFSPDEKQLVVANDRGEICFWDVETAKLTRKLTGPREAHAESLAFSPDGKYLAGGGSDHAIHLWDLGAGKEVLRSAHPLGGEVSAMVLADGKTLLTHCSYRYDRIFRSTLEAPLAFWDLNGKSLQQTTFNLEKAHELALTADAGVAALAQGPHFGFMMRPVPNKWLRSSIRLCDRTTGKEFVNVADVPSQITDMRFSPNGSFLFVGAFNAGPNEEDFHHLAVVQLWKRTSPTTLKKIADLPSRYFTLSFCCAPDSRWVAVPSRPGCKFYECETGRLLRHGPEVAGAVRAASPSGRLVACADDKERTACVIEVATGKTICKLDCKPRYLVRPRFAISPDGRIVASDLNSETITLWDIFTGKQLCKLQGHRGHIHSLCFSPDGRFLVSGSSDTTVLIWDYRKMLPAAAPSSHAPERLEKLWQDLHEHDAERAYRAVAALVQSPEQSIALLRKKITPPTAADLRRIQQWIDDLGNDAFTVRARAEAELARRSDLAEPALRQALRSDALPLETTRRIEGLLGKLLSVAPGPWLATLRGFEVLELIGSPQARGLLEELSAATPESPLTQEARRSLERVRLAGQERRDPP